MKITALTYNISWATQKNILAGSEKNFVQMCQNKDIKCFDNTIKIIQNIQNLHLIGLQEVNTRNLEKNLIKSLEYCDSFEDKNNIRWGDIGPSLVRNAIKKYNLQKYIKDYKIFMPVNWWEANEFFNPNPTFQITPDTYSIHLWNDVWSSNGIDKNGDFHSNSIYEQLKKWVNI